MVLIREKKKTRAQRTTRRVPLVSALGEVLKEYLKTHPGGEFLFAQGGVIGRSKKRSQTTGHLDEKKRPSGLKARLSTVKARGEVAAADTTARVGEEEVEINQEVAGQVLDALRAAKVVRGFGGNRQPPPVPSGDYLVRVTVDGKTLERVLRVERVSGAAAGEIASDEEP
jgi:hypothetical protein